MVIRHYKIRMDGCRVNTLIISLILSMAPFFDIKPELAVAIARTESSLRPNVIGSVGEVGLFQIRPKYSKYTAEELKNPVINITEGMRFLQFAKKHCKSKVDFTWINCYNLGVTGGSNLKYPKKFEYYKKVMSRL